MATGLTAVLLVIAGIADAGATVAAGPVPLTVGPVAAQAPVAIPATTGTQPTASPKVQADYGRLPMHFEPNQGQTADEVKFLARGPGYALFLTEDELVISLRRGTSAGDAKSRQGARERQGLPNLKALTRPDPARAEAQQAAAEAEPEQPAGTVLRFGFARANPAPEIGGFEPLGGHSNYLLGNDPAKWRTGIPHYGRVQVKQLYTGIDLVLYGNPQQLEYDFVVAPGADPGQIQLSISGAEGLRIDDQGDLVLAVAGGELVQKAPRVYQEIDGERRLVTGGYRLLPAAEDAVESGSGTGQLAFSPETSALIGFRLAAYDVDEPLVIDPVVVYSTYLGGSSQDYGYDMSVDGAGNAYMIGATASADFPTLNSLYSNLWGAQDAFVSKLNPNGSAIIYSTYLGGSGDDIGNGIAVDNVGNVYATGQTWSADFPTVNALFPNFGAGQSDAFIFKLNASGSAAVYSTYLGGGSIDSGSFVAVDGAGNAYVSGHTQSSDFPIVNALYPSSGGGQDAFILKLNSSGSAVVYSTYLGGSSSEWVGDIAVDGNGSVYLAGSTASSDFPTVNGLYLNLRGRWDGFVFKLNHNGSAAVYSTYFGGNAVDGARGIAVDSAGNAYITGRTHSGDFPAVNALYPNLLGPGDAYISKLNPSGSAVVYSTFLGGMNDDVGQDIAVDGAGNTYITGWTNSTDFPSVSPLQTNHSGYEDAFLFKLNAGGSASVYSTYLGGSSDDWGSGITVDGSGNAYVTGYTESLDFPTVNALYPNLWGSSDAFIAKISPTDWKEDPLPPPPVDPPPPASETRHLVLITHGWNSSSQQWPNELVSTICGILGGAVEDSGLADDDIGIDFSCQACPPEDGPCWLVMSYNWKSAAGPTWRHPDSALANAKTLGDAFAVQLLGGNQLPGSELFVHLIGHSAGSGFVDAFAARAKALAPGLQVHMTLLDSYCPLLTRCDYGRSATWAEQYFDDRGILGDVTETDLDFGFDFDITSLDYLDWWNYPPPWQNEVHAYPYRYYIKSAGGIPPGDFDAHVDPEQPLAATLAAWYEGAEADPFAQLQENLARYGRSGDCELEDEDGLGLAVCGGSAETPTTTHTPTPTTGELTDEHCFDDLGATYTWGQSFRVNTCLLGNAAVSAAENGARAFAAATETQPDLGMALFRVTLPTDANRLRFDYRFTRADAAGGLQVFLGQDQLLFVALQALDGTEWQASGDIVLPELAPGAHDLRFVVKAANAVEAEAEIANIAFAQETVVGSADAIGVKRANLFYLDANGNGIWDGAPTDRFHRFGITGDQPIIGDWNGDGADEIGVYRPASRSFYLDWNGNGIWDGAPTDGFHRFGITGDQPIIGDWNSDGTDEIGIYRPASRSFYLDLNGNGSWDGTPTDGFHRFGIAGDQPIIGDWNNDGADEIGVYRPAGRIFYLDVNGNGSWDGAPTDRYHRFGIAGDQPIIGDWNSDGADEIGVYRPAGRIFYLDVNGNGSWDGAPTDRFHRFGIVGDSPIIGTW